MRYIKVLLCISIAFSTVYRVSFAQTNYNYFNIRACWISYIDIENNLKGLDENEFVSKVEEMYSQILDNGMNTVIVHVRAMGDAIYESELFPFSQYISENRKTLEYDPLYIMLKLAHEKGLRFEAWINPYRISLNNTTTNNFKSTDYYEKYKDFIIEYNNSTNENCLSFDPGKEKTVELIKKEISYLLENYEVDGIHFDDYFYVSGMMDELNSDKKKENVNILIKEVYEQIKEINKECTFGISPAGNLDNAREQGADIDMWLSVEGYVDYIMPQIYWTDRYMTNGQIYPMFTEKCKEWKSINHLNIPMYVGLALYRVGEESNIDLDWKESDYNIVRQYITALKYGFDGFALFRYEWLAKEEAIYELINLKEYVVLQLEYSYDTNSCISYSTSVSELGWQSAKIDGIASGITNNLYYIEAIRISLGNKIKGSGVNYRVHSNSGWSVWCCDGAIAGSQSGEAIDDIQIKIYGNEETKYDVAYRCYYQESGWGEWYFNGDSKKEYNKEYIVAVQIKVLDKRMGNVYEKYLINPI